MISVILVQHNELQLTWNAIGSLVSTQDRSFEIIVVDNASEGFEPERLRRDYPTVRIMLNGENEGFGRANNRAAALATGDILLFLNTDTECRQPFFSHVEKRFSADPGLGILGPRMSNPDGSFQLSAGNLPSFGREILDKGVSRLIRRRGSKVNTLLERRYSEPRYAGWVTGAALFIRGELFRKLGGFDPGMFMYFEDKDLCKRARDAGFRVEFDPSFSVVHLKGGSSSTSLSPFLAGAYRTSQKRYYALHRPAWERALLAAYHLLLGARSERRRQTSGTT